MRKLNLITKTREFLLAKQPTCPSCNSRIGVLDKPEKCSLCDKSICSKCIRHERFCETCAEKVPKYYKERYQSRNWFSVIFWLFVGFYLIANAWWVYIGWVMTNALDVATALFTPIGYILVGIVILFIAPFVPKLGTWKFYSMMKKDEYRDQILEEIEGSERKLDKKKFSLSRSLFEFKEKVIAWHVKTKFKSIFIFAILCNILVLWFLSMAKSQVSEMADTEFSNLAGRIFVFSVIINYLTMFLASAFYSNKSKENFKTRIFIEFLSWSYAFFLPLGIFYNIGGSIIKYQYVGGMPPETGIAFIDGAIGLVQLAVIFVMILQMLLMRKTPNMDWKSNYEGQPEFRVKFLRKLYSKARWLMAAFFALLVFVVYLLSCLMLILDPTVALSVISYPMLFVYAFLIFAAMKLVKYRPYPRKRFRISNDVIAKFGAVIILLNLIPTVGTVNVTNPSLDSQFSDVFGANWKQISEDNGYPIKKVPFSAWDGLFGYNSMDNNAYFNIPYCSDSPRFVRDSETGNILSNGTEKYTDIVHVFTFDLYLPAGEDNAEYPVNLKPGDGNPKKYPLVLQIHGLEGNKGTGNANMSSQLLANYGFAVCDIEYGDFGYCSPPGTGRLERGYDLYDTLVHVMKFFEFIENNSDYYHIDVTNTALVGRSWGGYMVQAIGYSYNHTYFAGNYSSNLNIKAIVPIYPGSKLLRWGYKLFELGDLLWFINRDTPIISGTSDPDSATFNPLWVYLDPLYLTSNESGQVIIPNTFLVQGTHDFQVPPAWSRDFEAHLRLHKRKVIAGYYPLAAHVFDTFPWSTYGQSVLYYTSHFIRLSCIA